MCKSVDSHGVAEFLKDRKVSYCLFNQQNTIDPLKLQLLIVLNDDKNSWDLLVLHKIYSHFDIIGHIDVGRC